MYNPLTASERIREARKELEGAELDWEAVLSDLRLIATTLASYPAFQGEASDLNKIHAWLILNG